ncbi:MAG: hypothetical protein ACR2PF_06070 [Rhizobiaceae bacterium]
MQAHDLATHFLTWQCRLRQIAMREAGGRPSQGMRPKVLDAEGNALADGIIVLLVRENPFESTEFLKFQVQKHNDPEDVYKKALTFLQSTHYQRAIEFSDEMTALFAPNSAFAERVLTDGKGLLVFEEYAQIYNLPCCIRVIGEDEPAFAATYWHSRIFNPGLGADVQILGFQPNWEEAIDLMTKRASA